MEFLKGDVNLGLLFLIIFVMVIFVSSSFYYHFSLGKFQEEYNEKVAKLEKIEELLVIQQQKINELSKTKNIIEKDKENLEENYDDMKHENEYLRLTTMNLAEELESKPFSKMLCRVTGNVQCLN